MDEIDFIAERDRLSAIHGENVVGIQQFEDGIIRPLFRLAKWGPDHVISLFRHRDGIHQRFDYPLYERVVKAKKALEGLR